LNDAWVAGVSIEFSVAASGGPVSMISISGDCRGAAITNSSLILISNSVCQVSIDTVKMEGSWGGGAILYRWPDPASGYTASGAMGFLHVNNLNYNADGDVTNALHDVVVLRGGQWTPSVSLHNFNLANTR